MIISSHSCLQRNIQVKFLQKDAEEQEEGVFRNVTEESLSPAGVDDEHAVQQVLTWSGLVSPVRKEEVKFFQKDAEEQEEEVFQGEVEENLSPAEVDDERAVQQVKFLQKYAEEKGEEDFNGGVEGSLSPAEVDDENSVQQVLTWPGQNILTSLVRKEEKVSTAPAWTQGLLTEEKREEGMLTSVPGTLMNKESMMGTFRRLSQNNWNHMTGKESSITATEKPKGVEASMSAEDTDEKKTLF
ncbi:uncharacterized protein LOC108437361 [Pygocentrus nattereri]|uniref:uncharacterized protein LOC108437361 n=1 Tax=Pygocentrus nattereri TaxID=42514 RepID=UPI00081484CB|nr:uncharacterized protein LOC108437361 [Pygocentrus nattereri]